MKPSCALLLIAAGQLFAQPYTRGLGVYPGRPSEYDGPELRAAAQYRNLALHRAAYQSSAYDYNLTAQLATDGIVQHASPRWITVETSDRGALHQGEREMALDGNPVSAVNVAGPDAWLQFAYRGGGTTPHADHIKVWLRRVDDPVPPEGWTLTVTASNDGQAWKQIAQYKGTSFPALDDPLEAFPVELALDTPAEYRAYRVTVHCTTVKRWGIGEIAMSYQGREVPLAGPSEFASAWMSAGSGEEWLSVDLGAECSFDRINLAWIQRAAEGAIEVSNDGHAWRTVAPLGASDSIKLATPAKARWVRVRMTRPATPGERYILSELEVFGRGGFVPVAQPARIANQDGTLQLARGHWRLERASQVNATGEQLSQPGFHDADWLVATVPGTVLVSYLNAGAIADPGFGENQYTVSDAFFGGDFWYRNEFTVPAAPRGERRWLNFDGINWQADVYLNGHQLGRIASSFVRARYDVTALLRPGAKNVLAVLIHGNAHPGSTKDKGGPTINGGAPGRDHPTFHPTVGWDWIPTIRGRDAGIWSDVTLTRTGAVTIADPLVTTKLPLPDTSSADLSIAATLRNHSDRAVAGTLRATFGVVTVEQPVTLDATSSKTVSFTPATSPALHLKNPQLWWPVDYGAPHLYPVTLSFAVSGAVSDARHFNAGVREFTYSEDGGVLKLWINGRRFIPRGGNWGFPESMLRYRAREYGVAMAYHRDQHFNMVRNWVGQAGDEAFYDAADRNGIVIWQDFWLANPLDGPNPDNNALFLAAARDYVNRIRNHASIGLYCGRNEGYPPAALDSGLHALVDELAPGMHYISSSADGPVSGHGPYRVMPLKEYFAHAPEKLHSEIGSPNVPELPILRRTLSEHGLWPLGPEWALHDFHPRNPFVTAIEHDYGGAKSIAEFADLAQFVDYNAYRGMFEAQSNHRLGLLIWMSHPAWPSILWQTYDFFYDTDAAYYAAKHACEPLHVQWNANDGTVEVVNYSAGDRTALTAHAEVLGLDGKVQWQQTATVASANDSTVAPIHLEDPASLGHAHFLRLTLTQNGRLISRNFYWRGAQPEDYTALRTLAPAHVASKIDLHRTGAIWHGIVHLTNDSQTPALMLRAKVIDEHGELIAPALYDDNYIALMPGESRDVHVTFDNADTRGGQPKIRLTGFNLAR